MLRPAWYSLPDHESSMTAMDGSRIGRRAPGAMSRDGVAGHRRAWSVVRRARTRLASVGLCVALLTSACAVSERGTDGPLTTIDPQTSFMEAATEGYLVEVDGCIALEEEDGLRRHLLWPRDRVTWDTTSKTVTYLDSTVDLGVPVVVGGGGTGETTDSGRCAGMTEWVVGSIEALEREL